MAEKLIKLNGMAVEDLNGIVAILNEYELKKEDVEKLQKLLKAINDSLEMSWEDALGDDL